LFLGIAQQTYFQIQTIPKQLFLHLFAMFSPRPSRSGILPRFTAIAANCLIATIAIFSYHDAFDIVCLSRRNSSLAVMPGGLLICEDRVDHGLCPTKAKAAMA
jgi:hypothetical protein